MKKNFEEWVCRNWYENFFTPGPTLARLLHTGKARSKLCATLLHMRNVPLAYVEKVKKRARGGSSQSAGIKPGRAKVSINFAPQSTLRHKVSAWWRWLPVKKVPESRVKKVCKFDNKVLKINRLLGTW